jgi:excisionase family DNA binding protein
MESSTRTVAERLGVSHSTVYDWIRHGTLPARRGPGGRLWIHFGPEIEQACRERITNSSHFARQAKARSTEVHWLTAPLLDYIPDDRRHHAPSPVGCVTPS